VDRAPSKRLHYAIDILVRISLVTIVSAYHVNAHDLTLLFPTVTICKQLALARKLRGGMALVALLWFAPILFGPARTKHAHCDVLPIAGLFALLGAATRHPFISMLKRIARWQTRSSGWKVVSFLREWESAA